MVCGCGVVVIVWLHYCGGMCAVCCMMNDDDALVVYCLDDKMRCDGDGGGTHLADGKCSVEAHNTAITAVGVCYMS